MRIGKTFNISLIGKLHAGLNLLILSTNIFLASCGFINDKETTSKAIDDCDDPDADINCCFVSMPSHISKVMTIASDNEEGARIIIKGKMLNADSNEPYRNAVVYAYHTDNNGYYSKSGNETGVQKWHGHLHGWCRTDSAGEFEIHTIKPSPYPDNTIPAHIHSAVKLTNNTAFYINDFVFSDDRLVGESYLKSLRNKNNPPELDNGVITLKKENGTLTAERKILIRE
jgi:protocatechuate 3,4-dioxygenase beta subunit